MRIKTKISLNKKYVEFLEQTSAKDRIHDLIMRPLFKHIKENREEITLHIEEQSPEEYRNTHPHIVYRADVTIFNTKDFRDTMDVVFSDPYVPYHVKSKLKEKLNTLQNP